MFQTKSLKYEKSLNEQENVFQNETVDGNKLSTKYNEFDKNVIIFQSIMNFQLDYFDQKDAFTR